MKNIEHLATFERCSDGSSQYGGTLGITALKKMKSPEFKVLLIPCRDMPPAMADLMGQETANPDALVMFAAAHSTAAASTRKKTASSKANE